MTLAEKNKDIIGFESFLKITSVNPEDARRYIDKIDPTPNGLYRDWIYGKYQKGDIQLDQVDILKPCLRFYEDNKSFFTTQKITPQGFETVGLISHNPLGRFIRKALLLKAKKNPLI